jgi:hypothetical protein
MSGPPIARVILYVRDIPTVAAFYERFFNMKPMPGATDGSVTQDEMHRRSILRERHRRWSP